MSNPSLNLFNQWNHQIQQLINHLIATGKLNDDNPLELKGIHNPQELCYELMKQRKLPQGGLHFKPAEHTQHRTEQEKAIEECKPLVAKINLATKVKKKAFEKYVSWIKTSDLKTLRRSPQNVKHIIDVFVNILYLKSTLTPLHEDLLCLQKILHEVSNEVDIHPHSSKESLSKPLGQLSIIVRAIHESKPKPNEINNPYQQNILKDELFQRRLKENKNILLKAFSERSMPLKPRKVIDDRKALTQFGKTLLKFGLNRPLNSNSPPSTLPTQKNRMVGKASG
ncbi:MAG TPA: hypothetical protein QF353_06965 [Gammaproteobacteria bacterium]|nr:hypothetical protein [Gammaproteobacteria bacterium]